MKNQRPDAYPYLPVIWASDIEAMLLEDDRIWVGGKLPLLYSDLQPERDIYLRYLSSLKAEIGQKHTGQNSPHIRFANATKDEDLVKFVGEFGPVNTTDIRELEPKESEKIPSAELQNAGWRKSISAFQDLQVLRREQKVYAAALALLAELDRDKAQTQTDAIRRHVSQIAEGVSSWPEEWAIEQQCRGILAAHMGWFFSVNHCSHIELLSSEISHPSQLAMHPDYIGHSILCCLLNAFRTEVHCFNNRRVETLPYGSCMFGIRPLLYFVLKHVYLGRRGVRVCSNDRCLHFYEPERADQDFCDDRCSQRFRQREYWVREGSKKRKLRRAKAKRVAARKARKK